MKGNLSRGVHMVSLLPITQCLHFIMLASKFESKHAPSPLIRGPFPAPERLRAALSKTAKDETADLDFDTPAGVKAHPVHSGRAAPWNCVL
jgi:hypothetical protein